MKYFLFFAACVVAATGRAEVVPSLADIAIEYDADQTFPLSERVSFEIVSSNPTEVTQSLKSWKDIQVKQVSDNMLSISMTARPSFTGELSEQYTSSSFVIDTEEESTHQFVSGFDTQAGSSLQLNKLAEYVSGFIDEPTYIHGFNIASRIAQQRSGDCTEYAVLTTALARSLGMPSKVVIGTVILEEGNQLTAVGHAWTEVWHNQKWQIIDSALYGSQATQHFYLPAAELKKEGPGFGFALMGVISLMPSKIQGFRSS